jgi:hypothetical protein
VFFHGQKIAQVNSYQFMQDDVMNIDQEIIDFLNEKVDQYNSPRFIESDPIQIPHRYNLKEDIEIAGLLTATISWGNRKMIIQNASKMVNLMGESPYDFIMEHTEDDLERFDSFVHRTFNSCLLYTSDAADELCMV